jgi:hypothetical protein
LVGWLLVGCTANLQNADQNWEVTVKVGWLAVFRLFPVRCADRFPITANQPTSQPSGQNRCSTVDLMVGDQPTINQPTNLHAMARPDPLDSCSTDREVV